jgi:hypothetical protein
LRTSGDLGGRVTLRQALKHSRVDRAGAFHRGLVGVYEHVYGGQTNRANLAASSISMSTSALPPAKTGSRPV